MQKIFYSHRLKSVLQHTVVDLGLSLMINDHGADTSIRDNEAMMRETALLMRLKVEFVEQDGSVTAVFSK